jgi:hypothetical protein
MKINESGIYLNAKIKSLKMTTAGQMQNGQSYGNSLKIKVEFPSLTTKIVANEELQIEDLITIEQKIRFENEELMLKKYKEFTNKKGQNILFKFNPKLQDGDSFWAEILQDTDKK